MLARMWNKKKVPLLLVGVQTCTDAMKINILAPRKIGIDLLQDLAKPCLGIYLKNSVFIYSHPIRQDGWSKEVQTDRSRM